MVIIRKRTATMNHVFVLMTYNHQTVCIELHQRTDNPDDPVASINKGFTILNKSWLGRVWRCLMPMSWKIFMMISSM